ncbi:MAG: acetyl-CoA carboxylase biotin carboxyl carrier protein [Candidatus Omnitrophica bacterium]|nr:acetyl-CoA carboxylase biotin carboxyl carrier protein [Candidatus Omnitrophota bacterium]
MEVEKLKKFIEFMDQNNLAELEIEEGDKRIRLKRNISSAPVANYHPIIPTPEVAGSKNENTVEIKSPMVGTFYRAPSPGAKPYAEVGQIIKPGDVVCIVEAMKLMNEIKAEVGGKIVQVPVENGEPVEFGQSLFIIEAA